MVTCSSRVSAGTQQNLDVLSGLAVVVTHATPRVPQTQIQLQDYQDTHGAPSWVNVKN